jgi:hypothetical protein
MDYRNPLVAALVVALCASLGGCASTPTDVAVERLDARTGTTLTTMPRPAEFLATEGRPAGADPYAYAGPFETNVMGRRRTFLWASTPDAQDEVIDAPTVACDGRALPVVPVASGTADLRLSRDPYPPPTAWNSRWLYGLDAASLACLATAKAVQLVVRLRAGGERRYASVEGAPAQFEAFRARVAAPP